MDLKNTPGLILLFVASICSSQVVSPELVTDRPDQTESAAVVPKHMLQVETGYIREGDAAGNIQRSLITYNTTLLRFGLLHKLELRLGSAYCEEKVDNRDTGSLEVLRGIGPLYTGFKVAITEEDGLIPQIAFVGGVIFQQIAGEDFRDPHASVDLRLAFSHTLNERFSLGYNLAFVYDGGNAMPGFYYSVAFGTGITGRLGAFIESYGVLHAEGGAEHLLDAGITYLLIDNVQLDLSGGFGINDPAIDKMLSCGLSFRLPR